MFFQSGKHLPLAVLRLSRTIILFLCHIVTVSVSSIGATIVPSSGSVVTTFITVRAATIIIRVHHSSITAAVSPHAVMFATSFAILITVSVFHLIKDSVVVFHLFVPILSVLDIFVHINQLICHIQVSSGQTIVSDF